MKKILCITICLIMLCGCGKKSDTLPITRSLSFTASINYYNEYFLCNAEVGKTGDMKLQVIEPEDISGLSLIFSDGGVTAEYMGITYTPKTDSLPVGSVALTLHDILCDIDVEKPIESVDGKNAVYEGKLNGRAYKFYFTPDGLPLSVEIPDDSFKIELTRVEIIR